MTLVKFNPEKKNGSVLPGFNDIFESVLGETLFTDRRVNSLPAVNIHESNEAYHIDLAAPGLRKEDFKVNIEGDKLTISSENSMENKVENSAFNRREFYYGSFTRVFTLPEAADIQRTSANYKDGILQLILPKKEEAKAVVKQIEIE